MCPGAPRRAPREPFRARDARDVTVCGAALAVFAIVRTLVHARAAFFLRVLCAFCNTIDNGVNYDTSSEQNYV